jgi:hypothetical protein
MVTERAGSDLMPGPQDQLAEQAQGPDPVRLRESDRVDAELQERMERLPPGHPSSPYNGDGSPKPPVPDPFEHDLPIPGDPDYQPDAADTSEADHPTDGSSEGVDHPPYEVDEGVEGGELTADSEADRSLPAEDMPREGPDGSWEWKAYPLSAAEAKFADQCVSRCREAEGRDQSGAYGQRGLTPSMRRIEGQLGQGELVPETEKYALKSSDRLKEKLAKLISDEPGADPRELASRIADGIRYTFRFPDEEYTSGVAEICDSLTSAGFQLYERKNAWADETKSYKGINSTWMDRDSGLLFEVQVHTAASWTAKQESHREYEVIASRAATTEEKSRARIQQDQIFARVSTPDGAAEIPTYRKEGW